MQRSLLLIVCLFALAAPSHAQIPVFASQSYKPDNPTGKFLPPFTLQAQGQSTISASSLRGHPALLIFWSTWCENCFVPVLQLPPLLAGSDIQIVGIDSERDPTLAPKYLESHHVSIPNFHDDGSLHRLFRIYPMPYPSVILLDEKGRVVFAQRTIFFEEFEAAVASLGPQYPRMIQQNGAAPQQSIISVPEARELVRQATVLEASYLQEQRSYVCKYDITFRDHYETGKSTHDEEHTEEVFADTGHRIESHPTSDGTLQSANAVATQSFDAWDDPIFSAVIQHSILSNLQPSSQTAGRIQSPSGQLLLYATFRGDPSYTPVNDTERIAQSLEGWLVIDTVNRVLIAVTGVASYMVTDRSNLLMEYLIPVLEYRAMPFHGVYLPSVWSSLTYQASPLGPNAHKLWAASLARTFGKRESCDTLKVKSTVLPGFQPVPPLN
jgi:peroxiredoxin